MSKLPHTGTSIFTIMSALATQHGAINLSQGFPNFPIDPRLREALQRAAVDESHQYMPMPGHRGLREKIAATVSRVYGRTVDPDREVTVTAGATQALFSAIQALAHPGDDVIMLDPSYDSYEPAVLLAGARPVRVPLDDAFMPDWTRIAAAMSERTRLVIINNPHNPSGRTWREEDITALEDLAVRHPRMIILSDEVYEFIAFDRPHLSVHRSPILRERSVVTSSFGKTFHITGWKIGYVIAPAPLMDELRKVHQFVVFCVNSVGQAALVDYLDQTDVTQLAAFYRNKRDRFRALMAGGRFQLLPCDGSYFQLARYDDISDEPDVAFCRRLVTEHGVAAIPLSVFNGDGRDRRMIRFCFAKDDTTLIEAAERLCRI
ncbi:MAG TPA: methionine aminotransferase [Kiritimatiellia bacterium]|nr:methionine aminotransferase [Kiritimatiellia bacterium]HMO99832.1 methionine aminotransferase [Kiritimatiellia bacterium]